MMRLLCLNGKEGFPIQYPSFTEFHKYNSNLKVTIPKNRKNKVPALNQSAHRHSLATTRPPPPGYALKCNLNNQDHPNPTLNPNQAKMPRSEEAEQWANAVYSAIQEIPHGKVTSYGHIALLLGERTLPRLQYHFLLPSMSSIA
jgi:O6-methylguanine-DNA--protein-cysteine methyltransferase